MTGTEGTQSKPYEPVTEFGRRNQYLAAIIPDALENAVDALMPDALETVLDRKCEKVYNEYQNFKTDVQEGIGEVAGVLFRVAKYAYEKFHIHDLVFGVYHLALHHATVDAVDAVEGTVVSDIALIKFLIKATDAAAAAYCPSKDKLCEAAGISEDALLLFEPETTTTRPAYAVWVDEANKRVVWGFRGTTDLNDMLTDACASCTPYAGGYAHWGMLQAAEWFVEHELSRVKAFLNERSGYELLLVGHSLGAGTAAMLAHLLKNDPQASAAMAGVKLQAVGIATPAVLTEELAEGCRDYITSVVLMHDMVPRFSIHNVFEMKTEMDATKWGDILAGTLKDWAVPDVIENSETYKKLAVKSHEHARTLRTVLFRTWFSITSYMTNLLQFYGWWKPLSNAQQGGTVAAGTAAAGVKEAARGAAETARAAMSDAQVVADAVEVVQEHLAEVAQEDVHQVFAPGRLFFIKRLDKYQGRAKYGNTEHKCVLCEDDSTIPCCPQREQEHKYDHDNHITACDQGATTSSSDQTAAAAAAQAALDSAGAAAADQSYKQVTDSPAEFYPGAKFELIEAAPQQRFRKIVLRETCLMDHLCGGYVQGLHYALQKAAQAANAHAAAAGNKAPCSKER